MDALPSYADPPFAVVPDMILDLPAPPSVNRTRKLDFSSLRATNAWKNVCNEYVLVAKRRRDCPLKLTRVSRFELLIVFSDRSKLDLDNGLKALIDYLRKIEAIEDDSPRHLRRLTVEFGNAPMGVRVTIRPLASENGVAG
jgi:Holliday junction resolvase RusA-like endonuclease